MPVIKKPVFSSKLNDLKSHFCNPKNPGLRIFSADSIANIIANTPHKRSSVFLPLVTLKAFIFQVLSDDGSCKQAVAGVLVDRIVDGQYGQHGALL